MQDNTNGFDIRSTLIMNVYQRQFSKEMWKVSEKEETPRTTWMSAIEEISGISMD